MIAYTVHTRPRKPPILVCEGFSWGAFVFGPLWLLAHRAWIPGILAVCVGALIAVLTTGPAAILLGAGLELLLGLGARDLLRWSLERRGFVFAQVVMARNAEAALQTLLERRPDLVADVAG